MRGERANRVCIEKMTLPEDSLLTPKIKFETQKIRPKLDEDVTEKVKEVLGR